MRTTLGLVVLLALSVSSCSAPGPAPGGDAAAPPSPAETVTREYFEAMHARDWRRCAEVLHPSALDEFKRTVFPRLLALARAGQEEQVLSMFEGAQSMDALAGMSQAEFFTEFMTRLIDSRPQVVQMLTAAQTEVLGEVPEGEELVHVVYRMAGQLGGIRFEEVKVLRVRRDGEAWRPLLSDEVRNLAQNPG